MGQSVPIPRTFGIAPEWRRQANSKSDGIQPLISLNPLPPAAVTQLCLRQYGTHYFTKCRTYAMFKTYPTFAAGTWLCAWTRTAAWVSLSGASALSTPATTPSSSPLQVTTSLIFMGISSDFPLMLYLISFQFRG